MVVVARRASVLGAGGVFVRVGGEVEVMASTIVVIAQDDSEMEKFTALQHVAGFTEGPLGDALAEFVKSEQAGVMDRARARE